MIRLSKVLLSSLGLLVLLMACGYIPNPQSEKDLLVQIGKENLYKKDIKHLLQDSISSADSIQKVETYIDQWIKQTVFEKEAEKVYQNNDELNRLLKEYKFNLMSHWYEQDLIAKKLNSNVSDQEITSYYEDNKEDFILNEKVFKCLIAVVDIEPSQSIKNSWNKDLPKFKKWCDKHNAQYHIDTSKWITIPKIEERFGDILTIKDQFENLKSYNNFYNGRYYLYKKLETKDSGETAPISIIENKIIQLILQQQKKSIIKEHKSELYKQAISSKTIVRYHK